jgi:hypothetical protein
MENKTKIYIFCNCCDPPVGHEALAVAEDGRCLAGHLCSNHAFIQHDMGLTSDWKHGEYKKACPNGYELIYIDDMGAPENQELLAQLKAAGEAEVARNGSP